MRLNISTMKMIAVVSGFLLLTNCLGPKGSTNGPKVILISIDGLRAELINDPVRFGFEPDALPNFRRLMEQGTYVEEVTTVFPSVTYPSHTSMITGELPLTHGIIHNHPFEPQTNFVNWYWYSDSVRVPSLITQSHAMGLVTLGISWSVSVGAPMTYSIPEIESVTDTITTIDLVRKYDIPRYFLEWAKIRGVVKVDGTPSGTTRDIILHKVFMDIFNRKRPDLSLYHIIQTDFDQHDYGKDSPQARTTYAFVDSLLGNIIDYLENRNLLSTTSLIITGDHGFEDYHHLINLNRLFADHGWIELDAERMITKWDVICYPAGGSAYVRMREPENQILKKEVRNLLMQRDEFLVKERHQLPDRLQCSSKEQFILFARNGYSFTGNLNKPLITEATGGHHGGDPNKKALKTTFIGIGRGFSSGVRVDSIHITQVAPIVSELLGLNLNCSAKVPEGLLRF